MKGFSGILELVAREGLISIEAIQQWVRNANKETSSINNAYQALLLNTDQIDGAGWIHAATVYTGLPYHPMGNPSQWLRSQDHSQACLLHYQKSNGVRLYHQGRVMWVAMLDASAEGRQAFASYYEKWWQFRFFCIEPEEFNELIGTIAQLDIKLEKEVEPEPEEPPVSGMELMRPDINLHQTMILRDELIHVELQDMEAEQIVPVRRTGPALWLATVKSGWSDAKRRRLRAILGLEPKPLFTQPEPFAKIQALAVRALSEVKKKGAENLDKTRIELGPEAINSAEMNAGNSEEIFKRIIATGIEEGASDIHLQKNADLVELRLRIDGTPETFPPLDIRRGNKLFEYIKDITGLIPDTPSGTGTADAGYSVAWTGLPRRGINFRLASITQRRNGRISEKITIRILDPKNVRTNLDDTNIDKSEVNILRRALAKDKGLIFVTGPTGSGKSTTLYAALCELADKNIKREGHDNIVYSIEQPIEYSLPSVYQIEANDTQGLSYAMCLRSLMRQDPDVILVGEVRDPETANLALNAADTGHLVLSTLHTTDTIGVMNRMVHALKINREQLIENLVLATAQRLYPKRCAHCRKQNARGVWYNEGCARCNNRGHKGRTLVMETLPLQEMGEIKEMFLKGIIDSQIREYLVKQGWKDYLQKARELYADGVIDIALQEIT